MTDEAVLSKEEMDALLAGVESGAVGAGAPDEPLPGEVRPYDFSAGGHVVHGPMPTLDAIHQRLARRLPDTLYRFVHRTPAVTCHPVERVKYADYLEQARRPALFHRVEAGPSVFLVVMDGRLVSTVVDAYFGGSGTELRELGERDFTPAEARVACRILEALLGELEAVWKPLASMRFQFLGSESDPAFVNLAAPTEDVFRTRLEVGIGEVQGGLELVLPEAFLEPLMDALSGTGHLREPGDTAGWRQRLETNLNEAPVTLSARLASREMRLREVLALRVGDIVPIDMPEYVPLLAEGVALFLGEFGVHKGRNAVKILGPAGDPRLQDAGLRPGDPAGDTGHSFETSDISDRRNRHEQP